MDEENMNTGREEVKSYEARGKKFGSIRFKNSKKEGELCDWGNKSHGVVLRATTADENRNGAPGWKYVW